MSFQGDVAGIGLGELLQGLARGGRDGVLTLRGKGLEATLGLSGGQLYLLPEPDENPEAWRKRCERAWVKDPNQRIDTLRMSEIAFAARLETVFQLLDGEGLHFRFEPGAVPGPGDALDAQGGEEPLGRIETGTKLDVRVPVHCHGISTEFLLLEYARLTDECRTHGDATLLPVHYVPRLLVQEVPTPELERFWSECDGMSDVGEIADRLGWPLRQCKATLVDLSIKGYLRFSDARELLALAQTELAQNRFARSASRLAGWCLASPPGPPQLEDAEMLLQEWERGKLPVVLASMGAPLARTLLRRIDLAGGDPAASVERWKEMRKHHRHDAIAELALVRWRLRSTDEADGPRSNDLLRLARDFQDRGWNARAGVLLHAAAERLPESTAARLEVGTRLIAVGRVEEGTHWVLEACRTMIEAGHHEKALAPLRSVLSADKSCREARRLFALARNRSTNGKRTRRLVTVGLSTALIVSLAAFVKVRADRDYDRRLAEIDALSETPERALELLDAHFVGELPLEVVELRGSLVTRIRAKYQALEDQWNARYDRAQERSANDPDTVAAFEEVMALPEPPEIPGKESSWRTISQLLDTLGARLEGQVAEMPAPELEPNVQGLAEERAFEQELRRLREAVDAQVRTYTVDEFGKRLQALAEVLKDREQRRQAAIAERKQAALTAWQDRTLAEARTAHENGDSQRAQRLYRELLDSALDGVLARVLEPETSCVDSDVAALAQARALAEAGEHESAVRLLERDHCEPQLQVLRIHVQSSPTGARLRLSDGSLRATPFILEVGLRERREMVFELDGFEPEEVTLDGPRDLDVRLSKLADLHWGRSAPIDALPVPVESGYVVSDRAGVIARLDRRGDALWERQLGTLGGVARTPVFLTERPGTLLALTEDGSAWLVEAEGGRVEGPWNLDSPPVAGPRVTPEGVVALFNDGTLARWSTRLRPTVLADEAADAAALREQLVRAPRAGRPGQLTVLRNSADQGRSIEAPWGGWNAEIVGGHVHVRHLEDAQRSFWVELGAPAKQWSYVAWEAPTAAHPQGCLWVSDPRGLRAYEL